MPDMKTVQNEYDAFLSKAVELDSPYGSNTIATYLKAYRERICSQIMVQLAVVCKARTPAKRMLSLGGWPGVAPIMLNRLTGIESTLVDHPALLTGVMGQFYSAHGIKAVECNFSDIAVEPLPLSGGYQLIECCQCIEHWNFSPIPMFKQIFSQLLSTNGVFFITVPNAVSLYRRASIVVGRTPYPAMQSFIEVDENKPGAEISPHWREYTRKDMEQLILYCGGRSMDIRTKTYSINAMKNWQHRIYSLFSNLHPSLRENIEAVCSTEARISFDRLDID